MYKYYPLQNYLYFELDIYYSYVCRDILLSCLPTKEKTTVVVLTMVRERGLEPPRPCEH